jgi:hypothetical protein
MSVPHRRDCKDRQAPTPTRDGTCYRFRVAGTNCGGRCSGGRGQGQPMMTVRTAMVSLLPAAICAQRPGDAIHGCTATLLRSEVQAIWPELGNESFQDIRSVSHGGPEGARWKERGRHPSTHDATYLRPRIDRPRG